MPDKIISYDNLSRFKEDLDVVLDDKQDALVNGENIKSVNGATILGSGDVDTNGNIAPVFSASSTYEVGDVVIYQHVLYRCVTAISTAGAWDSSKWAQTTVADEIQDIVTITATGVQSDEMAAKIENAKAVYYNNRLYTKTGSSGTTVSFTYRLQENSIDYRFTLIYTISSKSMAVNDGSYNRVASIDSRTGDITTDASFEVNSTKVAKLTGKLPYLTTAPSADNTSGFITIVVLSAEPSQRYNGFLYIVTSSN